MENDFYTMSQKYFPNDTDVEVDFGLIAGVGGAAVVVKINGGKVAKMEKIEITGNEEEAMELAKRTEFITIKEAVETMEGTVNEYGESKKKFDCSMILQPGKVFVQKIRGEWYLISGKLFLHYS